MTNRNKWLIGIGSVLAAVAAVLVIKKNKTNGDDKPPKKAPQLDIENPGSQHDFPAAPTRSDIG